MQRKYGYNRVPFNLAKSFANFKKGANALIGYFSRKCLEVQNGFRSEIQIIQPKSPLKLWKQNLEEIFENLTLD